MKAPFMPETVAKTNRILILTVGGAPQPIVASIKHWQPLRVIFVVSADTRACVDTDQEHNGKPSPSILTSLKNNGITDFAGRYNFLQITDPQDYTTLVSELRQLDDKVASFGQDYSDSQVIVDFTGGTKAMSAAMALTASRWEGCVISYVGGKERTKEGVGVVVDGQEQISHAHNPWAALGYLVEEQIRPLFNNGSYAAASRLLEPARNAANSPRKEEIQAIIHLCDFFEAWDSFQHKTALKEISKILKNWNNFPFGSGVKSNLKKWFVTHQPTLTQLCADDSPETRKALAVDLIANAYRRIQQGACDDAVARLYRAVEALAQARLLEHGFSDTAAIPLENVPDLLQREWRDRHQDENGCIKLGLQDDYKLLSALGDGLGAAFANLKLNDREKSPLVLRNASILAHGYQPVSRAAAKKLLQAVLQLAGIKKEELLTFPTI